MTHLEELIPEKQQLWKGAGRNVLSSGQEQPMEPGAGDVMPQTWCIIGSADIRLDMILESLARGIFAEEPVNFPAPRTFRFNLSGLLGQGEVCSDSTSVLCLPGAVQLFCILLSGRHFSEVRLCWNHFSSQPMKLKWIFNKKQLFFLWLTSELLIVSGTNFHSPSFYYLPGVFICPVLFL